MIDIILHSLGLCGDSHPKIVDFHWIFSYIIENRTAFAYTLRNTWHKLNII